jgi:hypothetical protein
LLRRLLSSALLIAWVVVAPFGAGALVGRSHRFRRSCARVYPASLLAGWFGLALLAAGAHMLHGPVAALALAAGGPLAGLSMWSRRVERDDDEDGGDHRPPDDDTPPPGDGVDWDEFERMFGDYAARAGDSAARTVRSPSNRFDTVRCPSY